MYLGYILIFYIFFVYVVYILCYEDPFIFHIKIYRFVLNTQTHIHTPSSANIVTHMYTLAHTLTQLCVLNIHDLCLYMRGRTHTHTHTHTHTTHTHTHTHTLSYIYFNICAFVWVCPYQTSIFLFIHTLLIIYNEWNFVWSCNYIVSAFM